MTQEGSAALSERLAAIRARLAAAPRRPWTGSFAFGLTLRDGDRRVFLRLVDDKGDEERQALMEFLENVPTDLAWLLGEVERLEQFRAALEDGHPPEEWTQGDSAGPKEAP